ncbi:MAG: hypothetical protein QF609_01165 [Gammaproteobacteria bacterium]|mgnify:CR=1 FL=1|jgi:hypothetical protein|nr:hypothetical protein [Gammaproteobacteria bacterium]|tara:strand:+ start:234 stop:548 length:315 start_codon:yes stop_codon:yes gene_type:complete
MDGALMSRIQDLQAEVDDAVSDSSKAQIAQCARLLATYVALYKHQFGELTDEQYSHLSERLAENLEFGESVYSRGLRELLETLALVEVHEGDRITDPDVPRTLN